MPNGAYLIYDYGMVAYRRIIGTILTRVGVLADIPSREGDAKLLNTAAHVGKVSRMLTSLGPKAPRAK
jgi:hypothetical protein